MNKLLRAALTSVTLGLASVAALANGHVTWSVGVNLPPAQVVVGNGATYYYPPQQVYRAPPPVYYQPAPVYHQPAPVYYQPPQVIYRPAPVYGPAPRAFGGWVHDRPPHWHRGHGHGGHRGGGW